MGKLRSEEFRDVWPFILDPAQYTEHELVLRRILIVLLCNPGNWKMIQSRMLKSWLRMLWERFSAHLPNDLGLRSKWQDAYTLFRLCIWHCCWQPCKLIGKIAPAKTNRFRRLAICLIGGDIAEDAWIDHSVTIRRPWRLSMGPGSRLEAGVKILSLGRVYIGAYSSVREDAEFQSAAPCDPECRNISRTPIVVGDYCVIGERAKIYSGTRLECRRKIPSGSHVAPKELNELAIA